MIAFVDAPIAVSFTAGMLAVVNPCGFALLPAYLTYFLGLEGADGGDRVGPLRALAVGLVVAAGFVSVFAVMNLGISHLGLQLDSRYPWASIIVGGLLAALGVALLAGFQLKLALPRFQRGGSTRELPSMYLFGVSYAIASLSCSLPIFLAQVGTTFSADDWVAGLVAFGAYALGIAVLLVAITVSISVARDSLVTNLKRSLPYVSRISGGLLVLIGGYVAWYGIYQLRLADDPNATAGPVDTITSISEEISRWIQDVGPTRLGLVLAVAVGTAVGLGVWRRRSGAPITAVEQPREPVA